MPKPPLGRLTLLAIGAVGLASALIDPQEYDYVDQRPNVTYKDVKDVSSLRDALTDRFVGKPLAAHLHSHLINAGVVTPVTGALIHRGAMYYTEFFGPAPMTAYRGLYTRQSEHALAANARAVSAFAHDLARCGIDFIQILHPTSSAAMRLHAARGVYRQSDLSAYIAAVDEDVRGHIFDLTDFMQSQAAQHDEPLYYTYGTHTNRLGADIAAVEISRRLTALGVLDHPLEPGRFSAPYETDRIFDVPQYLDNVVDDGLFPMLWGPAKRPQASYPPAPDGLLDGLDIRWADVQFETSNEAAISGKYALVVGDSFNTYQVPYFARMFRTTTIYRGADFNAAFAMDFVPDIVIYNHVARSPHVERIYVPGPEACPVRASAG